MKPDSAKRSLPPDTGELRRLAVRADADPRSVAKVLAGGAVRGIVALRIREVLLSNGYALPDSEERK